MFNEPYLRFYSSKPRKKDAAQFDTDRLSMSLFEKWYNIILARFEWDGLPDGLTSELIEKILFFNGCGAFFHDTKTDSYLFLPIYLMGRPNVYGEIEKFGIRGVNGESFTNEWNLPGFRDNENAVLIKNTMNYYPTLLLIQYYLDQLVDIEGAIKVNIKTSKTPFLIQCDDVDQLTMKNFVNNIDRNDLAIYTDKKMNSQFQVHSLGYTYLADKFMDAYKEIETRLFSMIGINHTPFEKKERLIKDEVQSNDEYLFFSINTLLRLREEACDKINKLYGLNISVKLREANIQPVAKEDDKAYNKDKEGDE